MAVAFGLAAASSQTKAELWGTNQFILGDQAYIYVFDTNFNKVTNQTPCGAICGSYAGSLDWFSNGDLMAASRFDSETYTVRLNRNGQQTQHYQPGPSLYLPAQDTKLSFNGNDIFSAITPGGGAGTPTLQRFGLNGGAYESVKWATGGGLAVVPRLNGSHEIWFGLDPESAASVMIFPLCPTGEIDFVGNCSAGGPAGDTVPAYCYSMSYDPERHRVLFSNEDDGKIYAMDVESRALARTYLVPANQHTNVIEFTGITTGPGGMVVAVESYGDQGVSHPYRRVGLSVWDADGSNYRFIDLEGVIQLDRANGIFPKNIIWTGHSPVFMQPGNIVVQSGGVVVNGDTSPASSNGTDFGVTNVFGGTVSHTFTVWNLGPANLSLGSVTLSGANAADFIVSTPPSSQVASSNTTTFQITFHPITNGARTATVTFSNSSWNDNPFSFAIQGWGLGEGDVDRDFNPGASNGVNSVAVKPDSKILVGGAFTNLSGVGRNFFARLQADGSLDTLFNFSGSGPNSTVCATALQPDGKIVVSGQFTAVNGTSRPRIARLNTDGSLDNTFSASVNDTVYATALQPDGKVLMGGAFTNVNGLTRNYVARVGANGALDITYNPTTGADGVVHSLALQPDGKILIGGEFSFFNGASHTHLARINANGVADGSFNTAADGTVYTIAIQPDGNIIVGGAFTSINGTPRNHLARLTADGSLDASFDPSPDGDVLSVALQANGKLVIGGDFTSVLGTNRLHIARLNADGTVDPSLDPCADSNVLGVTLQTDGGLLLAGDFNTVGGLTRNHLARVLNGPATSTLSVTSSARVQWLRGGSAPETLRVTFEMSNNGGTNWTSSGAGTRIQGGWELTGLSLPSSGMVRARAYPESGYHNSSSSLVEELVSFPAAPLITGIRPQSNGAMQITATGSPGFSYVLEASTNLTQGILWQPARTNNSDGFGNLNFLDSSATNFPQRFYRARSF